MRKNTCKYCKAVTANFDTCNYCKEKMTIISRILKMLKH